MHKITEAILVFTCFIGIAAGGVYLIEKNPKYGCVDYFFGKACGVNVTK